MIKSRKFSLSGKNALLKSNVECEVILIDVPETPIERPKKIKNKKRVKNPNNRQKHFYSGKKKKHTIKSQIVIDKKIKKVICLNFYNGKNMILGCLKRVEYGGQLTLRYD